MTIQQLLQLTIDRGASDLHLMVGFPPTLRINGELVPVASESNLTEADMETLLLPVLTESQKNILHKDLELDLGLDFENKARFRANFYRQKGSLAGAFRLIPLKIRTLDEVGLPPVVAKLTELKQGLVLVTGPTGHGKTTTLAAFINQINTTRRSNILTVEDPIEFVYPQAKSLISQRELNADTHSWGNALRSALREDPDIVLIGELRDLDTMSAAMTIAETGHLVFATLHTNSAAQTIDRIIDVFPTNQQPQIKAQLSAVIEAVISQRLIPTINPGRTLAAEILFGVPALRSLIRDSKTHLIENLIQTSAELGMRSMDSSLALLVKEGKISAEIARTFSPYPQILNKLLNM